MKTTTVSSSNTTLASACPAAMAQKTHPGVALCVMRAIVGARRERRYRDPSSSVARAGPGPGYVTSARFR